MSAEQETNSAIETPVTEVADDATKEVAAVVEDPAAKPVDRDGKGRYRNPVQPRIDELTRGNHERDREIAYWRGRAEQREAKEAQAAAAKAAEKPTPDKYDDYGAYVEALADWKADEKIKANNETQRAESAKEREGRERRERWTERSEAARKVHQDYDQVLTAASDVRLSDHVTDALDDSEHSGRLLYQIAKDPSIADRLNAMTPRQAAMELARMETKLEPVSADSPDPEEVPADKPAATPVRKTTSAPPPVKPITRGAATKQPLEKLGMDDYVKRRVEEKATWARR